MHLGGIALYIVSVQFLRKYLLRIRPTLKQRRARPITLATRDQLLAFCDSMDTTLGHITRRTARDIERNDAAVSCAEDSLIVRRKPDHHYLAFED